MGSDKYPSETHYSKYLSRHGGGANAFTKEEETNFYFHADSSALAGALDIFAQFFIYGRDEEESEGDADDAVDDADDEDDEDDDDGSNSAWDQRPLLERAGSGP